MQIDAAGVRARHEGFFCMMGASPFGSRCVVQDGLYEVRLENHKKKCVPCCRYDLVYDLRGGAVGKCDRGAVGSG